MTKDFEAQLRAAGYTDAQIAKEAAYLERVAYEAERIRYDAAWDYGLHHVDEEA